MFKNFLRDSIGFTFANIFIKALNLILIPVYVRFLSYEDYGIFELVTTLTIIFVAVVSLEVTQSILRFVADQSSSKEIQSQFIKNGLHVIFISSIIFISIIYVFSSSISEVLFETNQYNKVIEITSWIIAIQCINYSISVIYRSQKRFYFAIRHSIIVAILSGTFALTFLIISSGSLTALLKGLTLGGSIAALIGLFNFRKEIFFVTDLLVAKKMLLFSIPLVFSSIAIHLASFADRIIINDLLTLEALATYGIAAKVGSLITILIAGVQGALSPHFISTWNTSFGLKSLTEIFFIYLAISIFLLIFLNIFGKNLLIFLGTIKAVGGTNVLLILASASIVNGLNVFLFGLVKSLKTWLLSIIYFSTAILNIFLNYYLINIYGIEGAAFATLISASAGFLIHFYFSSKHLKLPFSFFIPFCFIIMILILNILMVA